MGECVQECLAPHIERVASVNGDDPLPSPTAVLISCPVVIGDRISQLLDVVMKCGVEYPFSIGHAWWVGLQIELGSSLLLIRGIGLL